MHSLLSVFNVASTTSHETLYLAIAILGIIFIFLIIRTFRPRLFYFVRHGETVSNANGIRQSAEGPLSEKGRMQADATGAFLEQFHIQRLIVSPFERTKETAAIINNHLRVPVRYSKLIVERRNPTEIIGKTERDPEIAHIVDLIDRTFHKDDYRYSDEENFNDLKQRALRALAYLSRRHHARTCVVTHSIFLKMLIAVLLYREDLHAADYVKLFFFNASDNASVTVCEYRPLHFFSKTRGWRVLEYNLHPEVAQQEI